MFSFKQKRGPPLLPQHKKPVPPQNKAQPPTKKPVPPQNKAQPPTKKPVTPQNKVQPLLQEKSIKLPSQLTFTLPCVTPSNNIPRVIYQTWIVKQLYPDMNTAVEKIKSANPGFEHRLFDDMECRDFIAEHYPYQVLWAYESLVPGAYKADLWRYCVLYLYGGVYLDIKFEPVDGFSFESVLDKEQFCLDWRNSWHGSNHGIYNAYMATRPGNPILGNAIQDIVKHVYMKEYGVSHLSPTGPLLLGKYIPKEVCTCAHEPVYIHYNQKIVLRMYPKYRSDVTRTPGKYVPYPIHWKNHTMYRDIELDRYLHTVPLPSVPFSEQIPRVIYQTWSTTKLPKRMSAAMTELRKKNPTFRHILYDDNQCREFIRINFPAEILYAYDSLRPGAYKADLWRYCILYLYGGVYLDAKFTPCSTITFEELIQQEHFCIDREHSWTNTDHTIYNAFMITRPGNRALYWAIQEIYRNVLTKYYGEGTLGLAPTGPLLLGRFVPKEVCTCTHGSDSITLNNVTILNMYNGYREEQNNTFANSNTQYYTKLWRNKEIYNNIPRVAITRDVTVLPNSLFTTPFNYNCAVLRDGNRQLRAFYRVCELQNYDIHKSSIYTCRIDDSTMKPDILTCKKLVLVTGASRKIEDPRAVWFNGFFYLTYTDNTVTYVAKVNALGETVFSHCLEKPRRIRYDDFREKNWIPFLFNNKLCILYSANPNVIFNCVDTGTRIEIEEIAVLNKSTVICPYGDIRGGCPAVQYDSKYQLWFFHTAVNRVYMIGGMLTDSRGRIVAITRIPIAVGDQILFPCGAYPQGNGWRITCGIHNRNIGYLDITRDALEPYWRWNT